MKKYLMFFPLAALQFSGMAQSNSEKEPYMTKSLTGETVKDVQVETSGGAISVSGVNPSEAKIEVYISSNNGKNDLSKEEIQQRLNEKYDLTVSVENGKLVAIAKPKERITDWKKALNISFKVFVPREVSTNLSTSGGSITLDNLSGQENFSTSGGSLHLDNLTGHVHGGTSGGSIHVANSKDDIDLTTSGGHIEAKDCDGKLKLSTSGGSLDLTNLKGEINAGTSGGSIHGNNIEGELITHTSGGSIHLNDLSCSLETSTSGGSVEVVMKDLGKYITIRNSGGHVDLTVPKNKGLDLDLSGRIADTHFENFSGKINENEVNGKLNGGGIPVKIESSGGKIYLDLK